MRIFLTSYDIVTRDIDILKTIPFLFVVLDEGTKIKNPQTKRTIAVKQLNAAHRISLSGTPIENRPAELWSIFDFLMKGHLGTYRNFISKFEKPILKGDISSPAELAKRIHPFILRRLKEDVAKDLPEKIQMEEWCSLTEEQKTLYSQIQNLGVKPIRDALQKGEKINYTTSIFPLITKLKQVCNHPSLITGKTEPLLGRSEKFDLVIKKIIEFKEKKENTVLFSHFLGTLDLFEKYFNNERIKYIRIDGSTQNRQSLIDRFNKGRTSVALCSIIACCHGIDLTSANNIIHVDRWWNPAIEDQATDRVHRIGQTKTVYVHKILTMGTLEEKIATLLERKRKISDKIINAATMGEMKWTKKELVKILEPFSN
jgi:SNF2 family DNA or RNA helicase